MERLKRREKYLINLVSRLGLEPRALALKELIKWAINSIGESGIGRY
jgi:hypothetical protein